MTVWDDVQTKMKWEWFYERVERAHSSVDESKEQLSTNFGHTTQRRRHSCNHWAVYDSAQGEEARPGWLDERCHSKPAATSSSSTVASRGSAEFVPTGRDSGQQAGVPGLGTLFSVSRMPLPNSHRLPDTSHRKGRHDTDKNRSTFGEASRNVWCRIFFNSH